MKKSVWIFLCMIIAAVSSTPASVQAAPGEWLCPWISKARSFLMLTAMAAFQQHALRGGCKRQPLNLLPRIFMTTRPRL